MVTSFRVEQQWKAELNMRMTLAGMVVFVRLPGQAISSVRFLLKRTPPTDVYQVLALSTVIAVRLKQPLKTLSPMFETLAGMVIEVKLKQSLKAAPQCS